ncbi:jun dimerization protein 2 isoform X1 [Zalophus californianus]|uniref:Jun dimerization protein 2 isoform X1 n=1 Tax=Zalophus californianus TaxID=9704 RepID=A0A6J2B110_ZALCA|nr:jun dimerization protein 2 isoform X1 [Zalophus californianus]
MCAGGLCASVPLPTGGHFSSGVAINHLPLEEDEWWEYVGSGSPKGEEEAIWGRLRAGSAHGSVPEPKEACWSRTESPGVSLWSSRESGGLWPQPQRRAAPCSEPPRAEGRLRWPGWAAAPPAMMPGQIPDPSVTAGSLPGLGPLTGLPSSALTAEELKYADIRNIGAMIAPLHFLEVKLGKRPQPVKSERETP